jgi:surface polysaccharide O-acyltransferase-like enzyme
MNISKDLSSSFMVANLFATILIVALHYGFKDISRGYNLNYFIVEAVTNGIARSAVPIFALISGYFVLNKVSTLKGYQRIISTKIHTLVVPYLAASTLVFFSSVAGKAILNQEQGQLLDLSLILYRVVAHPLATQFWFLRDLIILIIISPVLFNMNKYFHYGIGAFLFVCWFMDIQLFPIVAGWHIVNVETIFFFWLGGTILRSSFNFHALIFCKNTTKSIVTITWFMVIAFRIHIDPDFSVWYIRNYTIESLILYKLAILLGTINLLQLSSIVRKNKYLIYASGLTFFVYLFHTVPLRHFTVYTNRIIEAPYLFYINFPVALVLVFLCAYIAAKYFPLFYNLVSRGRSPSKALARMTW